MTKNPIERHMKGLRLTANELAWQAGISHSAVSQVYNAKLPLSPNVADGLSRSLRFDKLSLLVANALWRKSRNMKLNASESAFLSAAEAISGGDAEELTMILNGGLYFLDCALHPIQRPPAILLAKKGGK